MCLISKRDDTLDFYKRNKDKTIEIYKIVTILYDSINYTKHKIISGPYYYYSYFYGINVCPRYAARQYLNWTYYAGVFHVYIKEPNELDKTNSSLPLSYLLRKTKEQPREFKIIKFTANIENLVGVNYETGEAGFTELHLSKEEYDKAIGAADF